MVDKVDALTTIIDHLDLNPQELSYLIDYCNSLTVEVTTSKFTPGDIVRTSEGNAYVHKVKGTTVLVRYPGRFFEEWLDDEYVNFRTPTLDDQVSHMFVVGSHVRYGDSNFVVTRVNNAYALIIQHNASELWVHNSYLSPIPQ